MNNCVFCKIIEGSIPSKKVYEDEEMIIIRDAAPQAPVHLLAIPKKHIPNIMEMGKEDAALAGRLMVEAARALALQGCEENGGRFVINCKSDGQQSVPHLHIHALGGRLMDWPPG